MTDKGVSICQHAFGGARSEEIACVQRDAIRKSVGLNICMKVCSWRLCDLAAKSESGR